MMQEVQELFITAIKKGELDKVKRFAEKEPVLLNSPLNDNGCYAIHIAAEAGYLEMAQYFLEKNEALINQTDNFGHTPIMLAAFNSPPRETDPIVSAHAWLTSFVTSSSIHPNHVEVISYLVKQGANLFLRINCPEGSYHGYSIYDLPLYESIKQLLCEDQQPTSTEAWFYHISYAQSGYELLYAPEIKLDVLNYVDIHGNILVDYLWFGSRLLNLIQDNMADIKGHVRQLLLDKLLHKYASKRVRVDWDIQQDLDLIYTLLTYDLEVTASQKKNIQANFQHMLNRYNNGADEKIFSYMKWCIDICPELLHQINDEGITPLMWAIKKQALDFAHDLIKKGADQHRVTEGGYTAIHYAAEYLPSLLEQLDYTDYLSPEKRVDQGKHLVHLICSGDGEEETCLKILTEEAHLIDIQDDFGQTPIVYAAVAGQLTLAQHLISMGAKLDVRINKPENSEHGVTLINLLRAERGQDRSNDKKLSKIIDLLIEAGAPNEGLYSRPVRVTPLSVSIANIPGTLHYKKLNEKIAVEDVVEKSDVNNDAIGWNW